MMDDYDDAGDGDGDSNRHDENTMNTTRRHMMKHQAAMRNMPAIDDGMR